MERREEIVQAATELIDKLDEFGFFVLDTSEDDLGNFSALADLEDACAYGSDAAVALRDLLTAVEYDD